MAENKEIFKSPKAVAKFAHISNPDTRFDEAGKYTIDIIIDPNGNEEHKKFLTGLWETTRAKIPKGKAPLKPELDDGGNKTGNFIVRMSSAFKPRIFDAVGDIIPNDIIVGRGSTVVVAFQTNFYDGFGGGMNLYLKAVQVLDLKEGTGASAESYGFEVDDKRVPEATPAAFKADDDNIPF